MKITLTDPLIAIEAEKWCRDSVNTDWDIQFRNIVSNRPEYIFEFTDQQHAILFMLRWAEYA